MHTFNCIKPSCGVIYQTEDTDAYLCPKCNEERLAIARRVDAKMAMRGEKQVKTALQQYAEAPKVNGFMVVKL